MKTELSFPPHESGAWARGTVQDRRQDCSGSLLEEGKGKMGPRLKALITETVGKHVLAAMQTLICSSG